MSEIYLLGREDKEGLARLLKGEIGRLLYHEEVYGWDNLSHGPEEMPQLQRIFDTNYGQEPSLSLQNRWGDEQ